MDGSTLIALLVLGGFVGMHLFMATRHTGHGGHGGGCCGGGKEGDPPPGVPHPGEGRPGSSSDKPSASRR